MLNSSNTCHGYHQQIMVDTNDEGLANLNDAATMDLLQYTQKMVRIQPRWRHNPSVGIVEIMVSVGSAFAQYAMDMT